MARAHVRTRQDLHLQRGFERSRLEEQLVATAYELAVPIRRQSLSTPHRARPDEDQKDPPAATPGGLSA